jgi:Tfp pilus assembly protein PilV
MKRAAPVAGFTLIEALVSVALIGIGFMGFQGFYGFAQSSLQRTTERIQANFAAQAMIEQIATDTTAGVNPTVYAGNLTECASLTTKRKTWCDRISAIAGKAPSKRVRSKYTSSQPAPRRVTWSPSRSPRKAGKTTSCCAAWSPPHERHPYPPHRAAWLQPNRADGRARGG